MKTITRKPAKAKKKAKKTARAITIQQWANGVKVVKIGGEFKPVSFYLSRMKTGMAGGVTVWSFFNYKKNIHGHVPIKIQDRDKAKLWIINHIEETYPNEFSEIWFFR